MKKINITIELDEKEMDWLVDKNTRERALYEHIPNRAMVEEQYNKYCKDRVIHLLQDCIKEYTKTIQGSQINHLQDPDLDPQSRFHEVEQLQRIIRGLNHMHTCLDKQRL